MDIIRNWLICKTHPNYIQGFVWSWLPNLDLITIPIITSVCMDALKTIIQAYISFNKMRFAYS